jgi:hypothetical protein
MVRAEVCIYIAKSRGIFHFPSSMVAVTQFSEWMPRMVMSQEYQLLKCMMAPRKQHIHKTILAKQVRT